MSTLNLATQLCGDDLCVIGLCLKHIEYVKGLFCNENVSFDVHTNLYYKKIENLK
jgi:hypothetical protein